MPIQHRKAAVFPLILRAHRILKNNEIKSSEIKSIFKNAIDKGYPIRHLKRWHKEAETIAKRPRREVGSTKVYRNMRTTSMDQEIRKVLRPNGVEIVTTRKQGTLCNILRSDKDKREKNGICRECTKYP